MKTAAAKKKTVTIKTGMKSPAVKKRIAKHNGKLDAQHFELEVMGELGSKKKSPNFEERVEKLLKHPYHSDLTRQKAEEITRTIDEQKKTGLAEKGEIVTNGNDCYLVAGDLKVAVHPTDVVEAMKVVDKLMDSQIASLAMFLGLEPKPFSRELLRPVLTGYIQNVWKRDIEGYRSDHLETGHMNRISTYLREITNYKEQPEGDSKASGKSSKTSKAPKATRDFSKEYRFVKSTPSVATGRETQLLEVMKELKKGNLAKIVEAAKDRVKTKQDAQMIILRFLKELVSHGAVEEIK